MWNTNNDVNLMYLVLTADDDTTIACCFNRKVAEAKIEQLTSRYPQEKFWVMPMSVSY